MKKLTELFTIDFDNFINRDIGNVTLLKELGHGNRGVVFVGFQKSLKRRVAVKILPKVNTMTEEDRLRFQDEAEILAVLSHPNIIPIFEMGEEADFYFQVMQLIEGSDLNTIIKKKMLHPVPSKQYIPVEQAVDIIMQVLDGLTYAHEEGIVHQDIKPANILMEERTGRPLIADFGIAKAVQVVCPSQIDVIIGSPVYISPEQASAASTDGRSDIYSVGVTLFKMLAGVLPRRTESVARLLLRKINEPETFFTMRPMEASARIDAAMDAIILKATAADLEARYQDCRAFKADLYEYKMNYVSRVKSQ